MSEVIEESYPISQKALSAFGHIPGSFSLAVYLIIQNARTPLSAKEGGAWFQVKRLLSVPKVYQACSAASQTYDLSWNDADNMPDFDPLTLCSILTSIYCHHRLMKLSDPGEWEQILPQYFRDILATGIVMQSIHKSGLGIALIGTTALYGALGMLSALNKKVFKEYRLKRKMQRFFLNPNLEMEMFHCSPVFIARELIQRFRYGPKVCEALAYGFDYSIAESVLPSSARPFRSLLKILDSIHALGKPDIGIDGRALGLSPETTERLNAILKGEQKTSWLNGELLLAG